MIATDVHFDLIHVGKCAGGTVVRELLRGGYKFEHVHMRRPVISPDRRYVVAVRDPMARFVSAFNWRRHRLEEDRGPEGKDADAVGLMKRRVEESFIAMFETANVLAEQLEPLPGRDVAPIVSMLSVIGHVVHGFTWYLDQMLDEIEPSQLLGVVAQENLDQDMRALFGIPPTFAEHSDYPHGSRGLSALARRNLARVFSEEYRALSRLQRLADRAGVRMSVTYSP